MAITNTTYEVRADVIDDESIISVEQGAMHVNADELKVHLAGAIQAVKTGTNIANEVIVNQTNVATTLGGIIDSTKVYFLDGVIDMSGVTVEVPAGGVNIKGFDFDVSKMVCSDNDYVYICRWRKW